jgi:Insulin-induced protein (INSIG)
MSIGLWWLFDRSRSGFGLGIGIAILATLVSQLLVYNGIYRLDTDYDELVWATEAKFIHLLSIMLLTIQCCEELLLIFSCHAAFCWVLFVVGYEMLINFMSPICFCRYTAPDFLYVRSWLPCIFFSGGITMGNIGRQLALVRIIINYTMKFIAMTSYCLIFSAFVCEYK